MCGATTGGLDVEGIDVAKESVIQGVVSRGGEPVGGAYVRLLDGGGEFTAEVPTSATGHFRFFAAPGQWTLRTLAPGATVDRQVVAVLGGVAEVSVELPADLCPPDSVDERPGRGGQDFFDEGRRPRDPDALEQVADVEGAPGGALRADGDAARGQHGGQQGVERGGVRQRELRRPSGHGEPGRLAGEPQRDLGPGRHRRRGDRERLGAPLGVVGARGGLHHQPDPRPAEGRLARLLRLALLPGHGPKARLAPWSRLFYTSLLVLVAVFITWFAGFVVYRLYKGQD